MDTIRKKLHKGLGRVDVQAALLAVAVSAFVIDFVSAGQGVGAKTEPILPSRSQPADDAPAASNGKDDSTGSSSPEESDASKDGAKDQGESQSDGKGSSGSGSGSGTDSGSNSGSSSGDRGSSNSGSGSGSTDSSGSSGSNGSSDGGSGSGGGSGNLSDSGDGSSGSSGSWTRTPPVRGRRSVWRNPPAEAHRTPCVRLWANLRGWIPPRAWRADLGRFRGRFQSWLLNRFRGWKKKRGRRKKQDKTLAPQAPPGRSRLPAVRAVSGSVGWRL